MREEIHLNGESIQIPSKLFNPDGKSLLDGVFSLQTWNKIPSRTQERLVKLLPTFPENDQKEKIKTLKLLLSGGNVRFGNPVTQFKNDFAAGKFNPDEIKMRKILSKIDERERKEVLEKRQLHTMVELLRELNPSFKLPQITKGSSKLDHKIAKRYLWELQMIRRGVGEDGDSSEDEIYPNGIPEVEKTCSKSEVEKSYAEFSRMNHGRSLLSKRKRPADPGGKSLLVKKAEQTNGQPPSKAPKSLLKPPFDCFFGLLKHLFDGFKDRRSTPEILTNSVNDYLGDTKHPWMDQAKEITSALKFLVGGFAEKPSDFVAVLKKNPLTGTFTWVGDSGRNLKELNDMWLRLKGPITEDFHVQEAKRMANPQQPFTYRFEGGRLVVVGPVRNQPVSKVKNHPILVTDRPPCVTIIALVHEAVARLPSGEGTKSDICTLLKQSQYINQAAVIENPNSLASVVSGALDRLQGELDPPCKYIADRKMWKYLHHGFKEEDFTKIKTSPPKPRKTKFPDTPLSQEELMTNAVNSILPKPDPVPTVAAVPILSPQQGQRQHRSLLLSRSTPPIQPQSVITQVQLTSPEMQGVLKRQQPSLVLPQRPQATENVIKITKPVATPTMIPQSHQILNIGGRQIILSGGSPNQEPSTSSQVVMASPRPPQQPIVQQQVMVQANIGGKTVLLSQEQFKKLGLGNIRIN